MPTTSLIPFPRYNRTDTNSLTHLFARDRELCLKFLASPHADPYIGFDYDVKVGQAAIDAIKHPTPDNMLKVGTLALRIDLVAFHTPTRLDIIEIKPESGSQAVGQLLAYKHLFSSTYPQIHIDNLLLVIQHISPDLIPWARAEGVHVIRLP